MCARSGVVRGASRELGDLESPAPPRTHVPGWCRLRTSDLIHERGRGCARHTLARRLPAQSCDRFRFESREDSLLHDLGDEGERARAWVLAASCACARRFARSGAFSLALGRSTGGWRFRGTGRLRASLCLGSKLRFRGVRARLGGSHDRGLDREHHVRQADLLRRPGQQVASSGASLADHETGAA